MSMVPPQGTLRRRSFLASLQTSFTQPLETRSVTSICSHMHQRRLRAPNEKSITQLMPLRFQAESICYSLPANQAKLSPLMIHQLCVAGGLTARLKRPLHYAPSIVRYLSRYATLLCLFLSRNLEQRFADSSIQMVGSMALVSWMVCLIDSLSFLIA